MTISSEISRVAQAGNSVTTAVPVSFYFLADADLRVLSVVTATGVETLKTLTSDYTVAGALNPAGGTVNFLVAPATGTHTVVVRDADVLQPLDLVDDDPLPAGNTEKAFDRITMHAQRAIDLSTRSLHQPEGDVTAIGALPNVVDRASTYLAFDASGNPIPAAASAGTTLVSAFMATVLDDANAAAAQATLGVPPNERTITAGAGLTGGGTLAADRTLAVDPTFFRGYLSGLIISNNVTDATNDIDIAVGVAVDSTYVAFLKLTSALTKRLDAAWAVGTNQGGLDTGAIANTTYHIHVIRRPDTGVVDILFSASPTAPTLPANYTQFRRIGSFIRSGGAINRTVQNGDRFMSTGGGTLDVNATNPGTAAVTRTLSVPTGIVAEAILAITLDAITSSGGAVILTSLDQDDVASTATNRTAAISNSVGDDEQITVTAQIKTNTSAQIRSRMEISGGGETLRVSTLGWIDRRGRDD